MSTDNALTVVVLLPSAEWPGLEAKPPLPAGQMHFGTSVEDFDPTILKQAGGVLWVPPASEETLKTLHAALPCCRWVHSFSAGLDSIAGFVRSLSENTHVSNGRGAFSSSLAEFAMTAMLHFNKQIPRCQQNRKTRTWDKFVMNTVRGKTLGLLGYGSIGKATAALGAAFGMNIIVLRRNPGKVEERGSPQPQKTYGFADAEAFYKAADFVVCSLPATAETKHFVSKAAFDEMGPQTVFISLGRGAVVDEKALHAALRSNAIGGAALDVFEKEPLPHDSPLWDDEKLLLTAHNADLTEDYFKLGWDTFVRNAESIRASGQPATEVDKMAGY